MKYTASIATWYNGKWHLDPTTETAQMSEHEAIAVGRAMTNVGMVIYKEYVSETAEHLLVECNGHLEPAFMDMVA